MLDSGAYSGVMRSDSHVGDAVWATEQIVMPSVMVGKSGICGPDSEPNSRFHDP